MKRQTKIVATLGPASQGYAEICTLIRAGMNIVRLNFSHGKESEFKQIVKNIRKAAKDTGKVITILQDLQGPKIRVGELAEPYPVKTGDLLTFSTGKKKNVLHIPECEDLPSQVKVGEALLIEDGLLRTKIVAKGKDFIQVKVLNPGVIKSHKGINIPDSTLPPNATITEKDRKDVIFGLKTLKVDAVALSFVQNAKDIEELRSLMEKHDKRRIPIIAKIERREALKKLESIVEAADGIMVARGDLGIEIPAEQVPIEQRRIVAMARSKGKPVIIATQILQSMVENPIPTRAEVSDASQAIFEHSDAFMLSNESAVGKYPEEAVRTLARVAETAEAAMIREGHLFSIPPLPNDQKVVEENIALSACTIAENLKAKAIVLFTESGFTARVVLKHRPQTPVIILSPNEQMLKTLNLLWGAHQMWAYRGSRHSDGILKFLIGKGALKKGDALIYIKLSSRKKSLVARSA